MNELNQLEIFNNTVNHKKAGKYLSYAGLSTDLEKRIRQAVNLSKDADLQNFFGMYSPVYIEMKPPEDYKKPDFSIYYKDIEIPDNAVISIDGVLSIPGSSYHFRKTVSPLRNASSFKDIEEFPFPDYSVYSDKEMQQQVETAHKIGKVALCGVGHMYEVAWAIRGYEQFLEDMILQPEWSEYILDRIKEKNIIVAKAAAHAGVDVINTADDVANQRNLMFAPDMWRKMMKTRWAEVYEAARAIKPDIQIWYHSDGNIEEIIPDLIEIGVTILNPVQPECVDPVVVKKKYGDKIVMDGTIGTQSVMPFGTEDEVRKTVRRNIELLGYDGALILSPTHVLEPDVPIDNVLAFFDEVNR